LHSGRVVYAIKKPGLASLEEHVLMLEPHRAEDGAGNEVEIGPSDHIIMSAEIVELEELPENAE